jgi:hypothetical protein
LPLRRSILQSTLRRKYRSAGDITHSVTAVLRKDFIGFTRLPCICLPGELTTNIRVLNLAIYQFWTKIVDVRNPCVIQELHPWRILETHHDRHEEIADSISAELQDRLPRQRKRTKLALLVATMLDVRT